MGPSVPYINTEGPTDRSIKSSIETSQDCETALSSLKSDCLCTFLKWKWLSKWRPRVDVELPGQLKLTQLDPFVNIFVIVAMFKFFIKLSLWTVLLCYGWCGGQFVDPCKSCEKFQCQAARQQLQSDCILVSATFGTRLTTKFSEAIAKISQDCLDNAIFNCWGIWRVMVIRGRWSLL